VTQLIYSAQTERKGKDMATVPDSHRDLLDAPVATLATVGADGRPQLSAVWFLADGDDVRLSLNNSRQKAKNLTKNRAATLFILDTANPARYLELRGDATLAPDDDYAFADRVGAKYGGVDLRNMDQPGEKRLVVTIEPARINAVDMSR
jgi:PPOX class probable F420-dependent enzyme